MSAMRSLILRDAAGVWIQPGQRVLYSARGTFASGEFQAGVVVRTYVSPRGGSERIIVRREDGKVVTLSWSRRVVVLQPITADMLTTSTHDRRN